MWVFLLRLGFQRSFEAISFPGLGDALGEGGFGWDSAGSGSVYGMFLD